MAAKLLHLRSDARGRPEGKGGIEQLKQTATEQQADTHQATRSFQASPE